MKRWNCGAPDDRYGDHQQGCPLLPPLSKEHLVALARRCEAGWREDAAAPARRYQGRPYRDRIAGVRAASA